MSRWKPGARDRLMQAAIELFLERGYENTTVADIAHRAGLTERTFFRQFADKREVLFGDPDAYYALYTDAIAAASADASPIVAVADALAAAGASFAGIHEHSRRRQSVIDANPPLQEREQAKRHHLTDAIAGALRARGVASDTAMLAAELGAAAFHVAFTQWVSADDEQDLGALAVQTLDRLRAVADEAPRGDPGSRRG